MTFWVIKPKEGYKTNLHSRLAYWDMLVNREHFLMKVDNITYRVWFFHAARERALFQGRSFLLFTVYIAVPRGLSFQHQANELKGVTFVCSLPISHNIYVERRCAKRVNRSNRSNPVMNWIPHLSLIVFRLNTHNIIPYISLLCYNIKKYKLIFNVFM